MALTDDWQAEIAARSIVIGRGTNYPGLGGVEGVGLLRPLTGDVDLVGDGAALTGDRLPVRVIQCPVVVVGDTAAELGQNYGALAAAWRPTRDDELAFDLRLPGMPETSLRCYGRPLDLPGDPAGLKVAIRTAARFRCGDPFFYGAEVDSGVDASTPLTVVAADMGSAGADTDRATLTIAGNGGTPVVTNTETGGHITFNATLAGGASYVVDLHTRTVTKSGVNRDQDVDATSTWFRLLGGVDNELTFSGCASLRVQHRPAYWTAWG